MRIISFQGNSLHGSNISITELYIDPTPKSTSSSAVNHYTFSSLKQTTLHFASALKQSFGLQKGDVLALFLQNNIHTPAVTFGTHYIGGVVSPANPAYTVRELAHHLKDSGAKVLVTQASLLKVALDAAREVGIGKDHVVVVDHEAASGKGADGLKSFQKLVEEGKRGKKVEKVKLDAKKDLAYLVYSSGTTGLPKGVMLSHTNVVSNLFMLHSSEGAILGDGDSRVLSVLPFYHIYGK